MAEMNNLEREHELALRRIWVESAFEFAKLLLTSLITVCIGVLVALLSFGAQKPSPNPFSYNYSAALTSAGFALLMALVSALFAYFNQFCLAFDRERDWLRVVAWIAAIASVVGLVAAGLFGYWAAVERIGH